MCVLGLEGLRCHWFQSDPGNQVQLKKTTTAISFIYLLHHISFKVDANSTPWWLSGYRPFLQQTSWLVIVGKAQVLLMMLMILHLQFSLHIHNFLLWALKRPSYIFKWIRMSCKSTVCVCVCKYVLMGPLIKTLGVSANCQHWSIGHETDSSLCVCMCAHSQVWVCFKLQAELSA